MVTASYDLRFLSAGLERLESYLLSGDVYWAIGVSAPAGEPPYPQMTLGALLLANLRARARATLLMERAESERLGIQLDAIRSSWRVAWGKKATQEFRARLTLWRNFLEEYRKEPPAHYDRYLYEVGRRVMLNLLKDQTEELPATYVDLLDGLDGVLRVILIPGEFVWESELAASFPPEKFWFLYGNLPEVLSGA